ncbi:MAG TPA: hypothetical protein EYN33_01395 [Gammaproteobacteria bacterium]|nr:hypothetical protein [Gammaproteobacteria bacterium]
MKVYVWLILFVPLLMRLLPLDLLSIHLDQGSGQSAQRLRIDSTHITYVPVKIEFGDVATYSVGTLY